MSGARELYLRLAAAVWGLAIAISLLPFWEAPPPPGQLPAFATSIHLDARAPMRFVLGLMLVPLLCTLVLRPLLAMLARDDSRRWARHAFAFASIAILWFVIIDRTVAWVVIPPALVLAAAVAMRRVDARFSRRDLILIPALATSYLALLDLFSWSVERTIVVAAMLVFATRLAVALLRRDAAMPPAFAFVLAPIGLALQASFAPPAMRHSPWAPLLLAIVSPLVMRVLLRDTPAVGARVRASLRYVIYPLAVYSYLAATGQFIAEGMPHADIFEDQQHMAPAAEMLRGEKPYRDIIPAHGLIQDALLDYAAFRTGAVTLGHALTFRGYVSSFVVVAHYALVTAATGSPDAAMASTFLAALLGASGGSLRILPAIAALALIASALRRRDPRWLAAAGATVVLCIFTSLDHGAYLLLTLAIALLRFRGDRKRALTFAAAGFGAAAVAAFIGLGLAGIAADFVRVTLTEIATLGPFYTLSTFDAPASLKAVRNVPEVFAVIFQRDAFPYLVWPLMMLLVVAAVTSRAPARASRRVAGREALLIVAIYGTITAISYAERHHLLWLFVTVPLTTIVAFRLSRSRMPHARLLAGAVVLAAIMVAQPTSHIAIVGHIRRTQGLLETDWAESSLPRARGAWMRPSEIAVIDTVQRYAAAHLRPGETWFDFTNRGLIYFLLDRDCPIRQLEVAFYEPESRQREVIRRIEQNPHVRFALMPPDADNTAVDGVPNRERAPLVYAWLQQHFTPDYEEHGVVFWRRK